MFSVSTVEGQEQIFCGRQDEQIQVLTYSWTKWAACQMCAVPAQCHCYCEARFVAALQDKYISPSTVEPRGLENSYFVYCCRRLRSALTCSPSRKLVWRLQRKIWCCMKTALLYRKSWNMIIKMTNWPLNRISINFVFCYLYFNKKAGFKFRIEINESSA